MAMYGSAFKWIGGNTARRMEDRVHELLFLWDYCSRADGLRAHDVDILIKVMGCLRTVLTFNGDMLMCVLF